MIIAHHFNGGTDATDKPSPEGTAEIVPTWIGIEHECLREIRNGSIVLGRSSHLKSYRPGLPHFLLQLKSVNFVLLGAVLPRYIHRPFI